MQVVEVELVKLVILMVSQKVVMVEVQILQVH
jgi:hypothetical protein